jgi:hypothetical protein
MNDENKNDQGNPANNAVVASVSQSVKEGGVSLTVGVSTHKGCIAAEAFPIDNDDDNNRLAAAVINALTEIASRKLGLKAEAALVASEPQTVIGDSKLNISVSTITQRTS